MNHMRPAREQPRNLIRQVAELIGLATYCRSRSVETGHPPHQRNTSRSPINRSVLAKRASVLLLGGWSATRKLTSRSAYRFGQLTRRNESVHFGRKCTKCLNSVRIGPPQPWALERTIL